MSYAISDSPTGPFEKLDRVLAQDPAVAKGSGHNSVVNVPGTDIWYIVYHRRPLGESDGNHRQLAYDQMYVNENGTIRRIRMEVKDNFADGNALGRCTYGGSWAVAGGRYRADRSPGGKALLGTDFADFTHDADVRLGPGNGDAGPTFRVTRPSVGANGYSGYHAGIGRDGKAVLGRADGSWTPLGTAHTRPAPGIGPPAEGHGRRPVHQGVRGRREDSEDLGHRRHVRQRRRRTAGLRHRRLLRQRGGRSGALNHPGGKRARPTRFPPGAGGYGLSSVYRALTSSDVRALS
ncbi:family 43 glycosylhydrolase [Streptomyces olivaceus]|uniref:family 43 glycosylhydrolase n=1 Tax=Streptomyces olivaceus TaxID=47716 RepID=UPI0033AE613F